MRRSHLGGVGGACLPAQLRADTRLELQFLVWSLDLHTDGREASRMSAPSVHVCLSAGAVTITYTHTQGSVTNKCSFSLFYKTAGNIMRPEMIIEVAAIACSELNYHCIITKIHAM